MEQTTIALGLNAVVVAAAAWTLGGVLSALRVTVQTLSTADQRHEKSLDAAHTEIRDLRHTEIRDLRSKVQALEHIANDFPGGSK